MISEQLAEIDAKFSSESKDIKKVHEEAKSATDGFQVKITKSFIALYYKQFFADIQIYNYKIKTSFVNLKMQKAKVNTAKTGIKCMIFILIFVGNCLKYNTIHDFSV